MAGEEPEVGDKGTFHLLLALNRRFALSILQHKCRDIFLSFDPPSRVSHSPLPGTNLPSSKPPK